MASVSPHPIVAQAQRNWRPSAQTQRASGEAKSKTQGGQNTVHVVCLTCGTNFAKEVLSLPIPSNTPLARFAREAQADLDGGTPIEMARQKLINTGLSRDLVDQVVAQAAGAERKHCPNDYLTYRATVQRCAQCGALLETVPAV